MNIFRFIADMLHLSAILILLYRIRKSRNCIGLSCKNLRDLLDCILPPLHGSLHVFYFYVQHLDENLFHLFYSTHNISYALQETILHDI